MPDDHSSSNTTAVAELLYLDAQLWAAQGRAQREHPENLPGLILARDIVELRLTALDPDGELRERVMASAPADSILRRPPADAG
jgi:hypothetical protein